MSKLLSIIWTQGTAFGFLVVSFLLAIIPEDCFKHGFIYSSWSDDVCIIINRLIFVVTIVLLTNIVYYWYRLRRKAVAISERTFSIKIEYGNLLEVKNGKKVIDFDECYTTTVGERIEDIKPQSVCGQYLEKYPIEDMHDLLCQANVIPCGTSRYKNLPRYLSGTIVLRDDFMLMAFTELNEQGRSDMRYEKFLKCLDLLWKEIDHKHGTDDVYLPILGSRIARFDKDLTQQELLDIMIASYRLSPYKLKRSNQLHIVCHPQEGFSLNNIYGVV